MKRKILFIILLMLMLAGCASAETHIPAGTINEYSMSSQNTVYVLDGNVTASATALYADADNITLKGNNYTVFYSTTETGRGLIASHVNNITIENINFVKNNDTLEGNAQAVYMQYTNGSNLSNCICTTDSISGIQLYLSNWNTLNNCVANVVSDAGIYSYLADNNTFINCVGTSISSKGIYLEESNNNSLINCLGESDSSKGIYIISSDFNIFNYIKGVSNSGVGIFCNDAMNNTFENNIGQSVNGSGIDLYLSENNTFENVTGASDTNDGFYIDASKNNTICRSTAASNLSKGMYLDESSNNITILDSVAMSDASYGLYLHKVNDSILNNVSMVSNTSYAVAMISSTTLFTYSSISSNYIYGIYSLDSAYTLSHSKVCGGIEKFSLQNINENLTSYIDVNFIQWNTTGDYRKVWSESSENHDVMTNHIIGDFPANKQVQITRDGLNYTVITSNSTGYIDYTYSGGYSEHTFEAYIQGDSYISKNSFVSTWLSTVELVGVIVLIMLISQIIAMIKGRGKIEEVIESVQGIVLIGMIIIIGAIILSNLY